ncbi:hypothetical protein UY3_07860 [Chelonia mydas]|uniref:Uncharacterized protein n=1 Tax=Chelonia mydas TaxID=8469 RepID=M7BS97_CHEMY|nr:hypothetical protein UY3_07860 [Chelonia mydas]
MTSHYCGSLRRHTTASMEPAQLTLAIRSTLNTTRIIQRYMQHQNLAERYRASRRHQRGDVSDEDMDTDFSQSMGPANVGIMVLMGQVHVVERRFWARKTNTDCDELPDAQEPVPSLALGLRQHVVQSLRVFSGTEEPAAEMPPKTRSERKARHRSLGVSLGQ